MILRITGIINNGPMKIKDTRKKLRFISNYSNKKPKSCVGVRFSQKMPGNDAQKSFGLKRKIISTFLLLYSLILNLEEKIFTYKL